MQKHLSLDRTYRNIKAFTHTIMPTVADKYLQLYNYAHTHVFTRWPHVCLKRLQRQMRNTRQNAAPDSIATRPNMSEAQVLGESG